MTKTLYVEQRRVIQLQATLLVLAVMVIGLAGWQSHLDQQLIEAQAGAIKAADERIDYLEMQLSELQEAQTAAAGAAVITNRGGERLHQLKWTLDEVKAMAKVVHAEARGESPFGKMMVARVIMNRAKANPDMTVDQIINRPNAFAQADTFDEYDLHAVFEAAIETRYHDVFTFFNPRTATNQEFVASKMPDKVLEVGNHVFCR